MKKTIKSIVWALFALVAITSSSFAASAPNQLPAIALQVTVSAQQPATQPFAFGASNIPTTAYDVTNPNSFPVTVTKLWIYPSPMVTTVAIALNPGDKPVPADDYDLNWGDFGTTVSLTIAPGAKKTVFVYTTADIAKPKTDVSYVAVQFNGLEVAGNYSSLSYNYPQNDWHPQYLFASLSNVPRVVNVSVRRNVEDFGIVGFVVGGSSSSHVLVRAAGPALASVGVDKSLVAADTWLRIYDSAGKLVASAIGWPVALGSVFTQVGAFPFAQGSGDSAVYIDLPPGAYTAFVSGASPGTKGQALVEVYTQQ